MGRDHGSSSSSLDSADSHGPLIIEEEHSKMATNAPIVSSCNARIRPLLDAVDKLRQLMIMKEGIHLPTIVVVGDQSSGKSSVLESLAGISLPRGQGICTRVPLIMRLQHHQKPEPELFLEFGDKRVQTDETDVANAISAATDEIAGSGKGIINVPLTLMVKKNGVPDLTMVDLPGITRVPVHGQPENIYEQIAQMIMEYIRPQESIILNVLSATVDFSTCESIKMSRQVDKNGERTLAVVTKVDMQPEGLLEKVTADDVGIGLGYICVRNRIGDESYDDARKEEVRLFASHPLLSKIDKFMVGIPVLARKLVRVQATIIARCLPDIVQKINDKLSCSIAELNKMPQSCSTTAEAMAAFMCIIGSAKDSLIKILLRGEYNEYPDDKNMHGSARLAEMLNQCCQELFSCPENDPKRDFLKEEIRVLEESKVIELPNFLPHAAFLVILQEKVERISSIPTSFCEKVWNYVEGVVQAVLMQHCKNYPKLVQCTRGACHILLGKMKEQSLNWVTRVVEMEKETDYTCSSEYMNEWNKLMAQESNFVARVRAQSSTTPSVLVTIDGFGNVTVDSFLRGYAYQHILRQAYDLRMRMAAYWNIVLRRLVDSMALHLRLSVKNLVQKNMEQEIFLELIGAHKGDLERVMKESPSVACNREKVNNSIRVLRESKKVLAAIMDQIATNQF